MQAHAHISPLLTLRDSGCVPYLDYLDRNLIKSGGLRRLIVEDGVSGVTTNPVIFANAIRSAAEYDSDIARLSAGGASHDDILLRLMVDDVRAAADELAPVYDKSAKQYGYVSLEVLPELAQDADGTVAMAIELFGRVGRPNILIKVPATRAGIEAVEVLISRGIGVNATTIFDVPTYEAVLNAYERGLSRAGHQPVPSVASFFVSRIDAVVDEASSDAWPTEHSASPQGPSSGQRRWRARGWFTSGTWSWGTAATGASGPGPANFPRVNGRRGGAAGVR